MLVYHVIFCASGGWHRGRNPSWACSTAVCLVHAVHGPVQLPTLFSFLCCLGTASTTIIHTVTSHRFCIMPYSGPYPLRSKQFGGRKSGAMNFGVSLGRISNVSVISNGTNGWQHLLHQYDVVIITAANLGASLDKNETRASKALIPQEKADWIKYGLIKILSIILTRN